jgi:hypothetical protein
MVVLYQIIGQTFCGTTHVTIDTFMVGCIIHANAQIQRLGLQLSLVS